MCALIPSGAPRVARRSYQSNANRDAAYSALAVSSGGPPFAEPLSCVVWLSIGAASGAGFFRAPVRRVAAFFGCGADGASLGSARREEGRCVAFGAAALVAFVARVGLVAAAWVFRALAVRACEVACRGAGAVLPRVDLAFAFSRTAFSLSLRAVSFSRIAASAALATCARPASGVASKVSKKALTTLLVPRGADVSDFAIEFCSPVLAAITLICHRLTNLRCRGSFLARACLRALPAWGQGTGSVRGARSARSSTAANGNG